MSKSAKQGRAARNRTTSESSEEEEWSVECEECKQWIEGCSTGRKRKELKRGEFKCRSCVQNDALKVENRFLQKDNERLRDKVAELEQRLDEGSIKGRMM